MKEEDPSLLICRAFEDHFGRIVKNHEAQVWIM